MAFTLPQYSCYTPGTYNRNAHVSAAYRGSTDYGPEHYKVSQGYLSESMVSKMSGPSPETTQNRTQAKGHASNPRTDSKVPDPQRIEPVISDWQLRTLPTTD